MRSKDFFAKVITMPPARVRKHWNAEMGHGLQGKADLDDAPTK
jgi:hypothetical protein